MERERERLETREDVKEYRPFLRVTDPKKTGARSGRPRARGKNPLLVHVLFILNYKRFFLDIQ